MNDLVKWGLIGVGVYLLLSGSDVLAPAGDGGNGDGAGSAGSGGNGGAGSAATLTPEQKAAHVTLARLQQFNGYMIGQAAAQGAYNGAVVPLGGVATPSVWNWYMTRITGVAEPNLAGHGVGDAPVDVNTYWVALMRWATAAAAAPSGLAGFSTKHPEYTFDMSQVAW